jgi:SET domain-containing protein
MPVDHTILVTARCKYKSEKGQCKRVTTITHPYCPYHTRQEAGVYVAKSTIKLAGKGLFAAREFKKGETVTLYEGERISTDQYNRRYSKVDYGSYGLAVNRNLVIDARKTSSGVGRYVCDYTGSGKKPNVEYQESKKIIEIVAIRKILPGEEFLVDYGDDIRIAMGFQKAKPKVKAKAKTKSKSKKKK